MKPLRVALADDEPLARARLARLLREAGCDVRAELADGAAVLAWLRESHDVEAFFLDIQMPGATGLEVAAELAEGRPGLPVVFVTAHSEHAVRAFEAAAADYILKPVSADRLEKTLVRLREGAGRRGEGPGGAVPRFPVRAGEGHVFLDLRRTSHFEVEEEVVWAWAAGSRHRTSWTTLAEVEAAFPGIELIRIQRHLLLRPESVLGLRPLEGGRVSVRVGEGVDLEVSRSVTPRLKERLGL
ncbi:LytTR family DNA-binding domain-containing protein [Geothrix sp. 21YS21S-4]|uniref:LytR/AlgR family response regulator transcription factor n=1 Tax=Geothrix sp. 21YS21S-4 TaxID=3068889 RepID=UPI0027B95F33|nr:LytTR family DNA-binding domain-containing protein [Geothrix sp. 21YS21S-4]